MRAALFAGALGAALLAAGAPSRAADEGPDALFGAALTALKEGRTNDAIADFEAMGDVGVLDPVVSFDRGLAYAERVRGGGEVNGDLGRAAHGFEEARVLTSDPALESLAESALAILRAEVARRRSQAGDPVQVDQGISLRRAVTRLLPENGWAWLALVAAFALGASLFLRGLAFAGRVRIAGAIGASIAAPALALSALLALSARDERLHLREGVIVAAAARMTDARHIVLAGMAPLPEAARVVVLDAAAGWARIQWASTEGFVPSPTVRTIARPE